MAQSYNQFSILSYFPHIMSISNNSFQIFDEFVTNDGWNPLHFIKDLHYRFIEVNMSFISQSSSHRNMFLIMLSSCLLTFSTYKFKESRAPITWLYELRCWLYPENQLMVIQCKGVGSYYTCLPSGFSMGTWVRKVSPILLWARKYEKLMKNEIQVTPVELSELQAQLEFPNHPELLTLINGLRTLRNFSCNSWVTSV